MTDEMVWRDSDGRIERFELRVSGEERRAIFASHWPGHAAYPGASRFCGLCGERWEAGGCPTRRAVMLLDATERELGTQRQRSEAAQHELSKLSVRGGFDRIPSRDIMRIDVEFDGAIASRFGVDVVDYHLREIRRQVSDWIKRVTMNPSQELAKTFATALADAERHSRKAQFEP